MRSPALWCVLILAGAMLIIRPFAEMGLCDDFSYVRTAKYLAQTGHLDYYGWATPMLGWQLLLGALFIKLFGFSFTIVRAAVFCIALALSGLLQRTCVRCGLREGNATAATLSVVLSPIFLPLSFSFMSDIAGFFSILLCLYCCLRAVQAATDRSAFAWWVFAALANTATGTARQIAWLGVLVMVPSTFWLIRHRRPPMLVALAIWLACVGTIFGALHWFKHQLYSQPEVVLDGPITLQTMHALVVSLLRLALGLSLFLTPVSLAFFTRFVVRKRRYLVAVLSAVAAVTALLALGLHRPSHEALLYWLAPFNGDFFTERGLVNMPELGNRPIVLGPTVRLILTAVSLVGTLSFVAFLIDARHAKSVPPAESGSTRITPYQLSVVLIPFSLAYCCLLMPRGAFGNLLDRYMLALLAAGLILGIRLYQSRIAPGLPWVSAAAIALFAAFGIAGTHDLFMMKRARLDAINQMLTAGIPPTEFYGGFEYDGLTQIDQWGYINANKINYPAGPDSHIHSLSIKPCNYPSARLFIAVKPRYALSFSPDSCDGASEFSPVTYRTWLPPYTGTIYIQTVKPFSCYRRLP